MGIRKWLQEVTAPGVLDDATREFLHPQLKSLATTLEQKHCKQIPQLDIDHSMIEVSRICKIMFFQECILTFLSFYVGRFLLQIIFTYLQTPYRTKSWLNI